MSPPPFRRVHHSEQVAVPGWLDVRRLTRHFHLHLIEEQQPMHVHGIGRGRVREPLRLSANRFAFVKIGVTMTPGSTTATRVPKACTSWARTSLAASRACFTAE